MNSIIDKTTEIMETTDTTDTTDTETEIRKQKEQLLCTFFSLVHIPIQSLDELYSKVIPREKFLQDSVMDTIQTYMPILKDYYHSSKLTCLHKNSMQKQKFPVLNLFRQLLKCHGILMKSKVFATGYTFANGKKEWSRNYIFIKISAS